MKTNIDEIWEENQDKLYWFIRSKISNECDAKDLLQQAFLKVKTGQKSLRDPAKMRSWIYQVIRNAIIDYYRSRKRMSELSEDFRAPQKETNNWELISRCVRPFIEKLPKLYREALILSEIEGLTQAQVAKKLKISLPNAKARLLRGRQKLKKEFESCCIFECGPRGAQIKSDNFCSEDRS